MELRRVRQQLVSQPLPDVAAEVARQLDRLRTDVRGKSIALTAGSRGIANLAAITRAAGDWLKAHGALPFLVPCMGSHNGATASGQRAMIESLGLTEEAMGLPIRSSMDVVQLGTVATGDVWMDQACHEADGVLVINRVKLHTCFSGPVQSGLMKMIVVGMGKIRSAETFHSTPTARMKDMILEMGDVILQSGRVLAGLAILEDGLDQTAEIHLVEPQELPEREIQLLETHRRYFPRLPLEDLNVLVVGAIGKTFSGTGMDTNVIGYRGVRSFEDLESPRIRVIAALRLAAASQGNAIGVGLADFITRDLRDAIDEEKTLINVLTTGDMIRAKIPATYPNDEALLQAIERRYGASGWAFIPNTLHLETMFVTPDLAEQLTGDERCVVDETPLEVAFEGGALQLDFD